VDSVQPLGGRKGRRGTEGYLDIDVTTSLDHSRGE